MNHSTWRFLTAALLVLVVGSCSQPQTTALTGTPAAVIVCDESGCAGDALIRQADGMHMVYVPDGEFEMGSYNEEVDHALQECDAYSEDCQREWFEDEQPRHSVVLDGFWIDQTEVSNDMYRQCVEEGICEAPLACDAGEPTYDDPSKSDHPVVCVDWEASVTYCAWAGARLPSEAEWEYAARGPDRQRYPWGDQLDGDRLNMCDSNCEFEWADMEIDDGYPFTAPVGSYQAGASWCGGLDLAGNVWEWVQDWYGEYPSSAQVNPTGPSYFTAYRVIRGGSWVNTRIYVRSALRLYESPDGRDNTAGFRCASSSPP